MFLNTCKFSQPADQHQPQFLGGGGGSGSGGGRRRRKYSDFLDPRSLSFYHSVQLQFYYPSYFVICVQQKPTKKPMFSKISVTLHGTNTTCFNIL